MKYKIKYGGCIGCSRLSINHGCIVLFQVSGSITNTGHSVIFTVENDTRHHINVTGGPLSYKYQFHEIHIHYGLHDQFGSEHSINGYAFPAEVSAQFPRFSNINHSFRLLLCDISKLYRKVKCMFMIALARGIWKRIRNAGNLNFVLL